MNIMNEIVATCRKFLWWETLCYPKTAGGVNFIDVELWNKAVIYKQLWNVCKKKDNCG